MHEFSLDFLRCVRCGSKLDLDVFSSDVEIVEGFLECYKCNMKFPIIDSVPVLWNDFTNYISCRKILSGQLFRLANNEKMKKFLKNSFLKTKYDDDRTALEKRWSKIYQDSKNSKFYNTIKNELKQIPKSKLAIEHGCSIGLMSDFLTDYSEIVFGIDSSFSAISIAKKSVKKNLDFFVADSLSPIFGNTPFDLVLALNVLELIEPSDFLKHVSKQIKQGFLVISDPYDFDRGKTSVKKPLDEHSLRTTLNDMGFSISSKTSKPTYHTWNLNLNPRCKLTYKVDLIIAKKSDIQKL